jgi:hypothetical protein
VLDNVVSSRSIVLLPAWNEIINENRKRRISKGIVDLKKNWSLEFGTANSAAMPKYWLNLNHVRKLTYHCIKYGAKHYHRFELNK